MTNTELRHIIYTLSQDNLAKSGVFDNFVCADRKLNYFDKPSVLPNKKNSGKCNAHASLMQCDVGGDSNSAFLDKRCRIVPLQNKSMVLELVFFIRNRMGDFEILILKFFMEKKPDSFWWSTSVQSIIFNFCPNDQERD